MLVNYVSLNFTGVFNHYYYQNSCLRIGPWTNLLKWGGLFIGSTDPRAGIDFFSKIEHVLIPYRGSVDPSNKSVQTVPIIQREAKFVVLPGRIF